MMRRMRRSAIKMTVTQFRPTCSFVAGYVSALRRGPGQARRSSDAERRGQVGGSTEQPCRTGRVGGGGGGQGGGELEDDDE